MVGTFFISRLEDIFLFVNYFSGFYGFEKGLLKKKRKKHKTKNDLRTVKAVWKLSKQIDIDTKDLIDIPELWPQI